MKLEGGRTFYHSLAFWLGTAAIVTGVAFHLPDFIAARDMHFQMSDMPMSKLMLCGMGLIVIGIAMTAYGLFPIRSDKAKNLSAAYQLHTLDNARLGWAHWRLVIVLGVALVVDVMKPATLGFVMPGMRQEYGISASTASLPALFAMIGTAAVLASFAAFKPGGSQALFSLTVRPNSPDFFCLKSRQIYG